MLMLKMLDIYIFKNFILRVIFLLLIISSIIILTNFVEMIDNFINTGMGSKEIFNYYFLTIPMFISYAIPMSITIGVVLSILYFLLGETKFVECSLCAIFL